MKPAYRFKYEHVTHDMTMLMSHHSAILAQLPEHAGPLDIAAFTGDRIFYHKSGKKLLSITSPSTAMILRFLSNNYDYLLSPAPFVPGYHPADLWSMQNELKITLTKEEFATLYGVSPLVASRWIKNNSQPTLNAPRFPKGVPRLAQLMIDTISKDGQKALDYWFALSFSEAKARNIDDAMQRKGWP